MKYIEILNNKPFKLNKKQQEWVFDTFKKMTNDEKIGQLFFLVAGVNPDENIQEIISKYKPGGFMHRPLPSKLILSNHKKIQKYSKIPALLSANAESGGDGAILEGTKIGWNMQVAATNDENLAFKQGEVSAKEFSVVGGNVSFSPVVDINFEWRNPVTNLRAYSDNIKIVKEFATKNVLGLQSNNLAATVKHFPGDGIDSRDHHITSAMNHLNLKEWKDSYGKVYKSVFNNGALITMVGHFLMPNLINDLGLSKRDKWVPTSYNKTILQTLLRKEMEFNGLIISDSTLMAGISQFLPRKKYVPLSIENGIDMFLFVKDINEDFKYMKKGLKDGILSQERLDDAVIRILSTKAKLNLHLNRRVKNNEIKNIGSNENVNIAKKVADKSITLIRNEENLFPFNKDIKKIKLIPIFNKDMFGKEDMDTINYIVKKFEENNIKVYLSKYNEGSMQGFVDELIPYATIKKMFDAVIYVSCVEPFSNATNLNVNWNMLEGKQIPNFISEIRTGWISLGSPYHLYDVPLIRNFINAYSKSKITIDSLIKKIIGKSKFIGTSPVQHDHSFDNYNGKIGK